MDLTSSQEPLPWPDTSLSIPTSFSITHSNPMVSTKGLLDRQPRFSTITSPTIAIGWSETQLAEYFARSAASPILATIETSARWFWMRKQLTSMTSTSRMVTYGTSNLYPIFPHCKRKTGGMSEGHQPRSQDDLIPAEAYPCSSLPFGIH